MGIEHLRRSVDGLTITITPFKWALGSAELLNTALPTIPTGAGEWSFWMITGPSPAVAISPGHVVTGVGGSYTTASGHTVSRVRFRWRQYNGTTLINSAEGATYTIAAAGASPTVVVIEDVIDTLGRQLSTSSIAYTITVTSLAPIFTSAPVLSGTGRVGFPVTMANGAATGTPTPTITRAYQLDGATVAGQIGASYTPVTADLGKDLTGQNTAANGVLPNATSALSNAITIIAATGDFVSVTNRADLQIELNRAVQGRTIECDGGDYTGVVVATAGAKTFGQRVTIVAQNRVDPPIFTGSAFNLSGWSGLNFDGLHFFNENVDAQGDPNGKINLTSCSNWKMVDCLFDRQHEGIRGDNSTNAEIAYCTFQRQGMESGRFYAGQTNLWIHHCKTFNTLVNEARVIEDDRHPDGWQFAVNGNDAAPNGVRVEDCWIENLQTQHSMHGVFFGNNACRPPPNGLGRTLAQSGMRDLAVRRCYLHLGHVQGVAFEGVTNGLVDTCLFRTIPGITQNSDRPTVYFLGDKFVNMDVVNCVLPVGRNVSMIDVNASQGEISIQVVNSNTADPTGWATTDVGLTIANPTSPRVGQYAAR